jgi:hypothetical protein
MSYVDKLYHVYFDTKINVEEATEKAQILSSIGYLSSDNLNSDILIAVEGKTDIPIYEEFLRTMGITSKDGIKLLSFGHLNSISDLKFENIITNYGKLVIIADGDPNPTSKTARDDIKKKVEKLNESGVDNIFYYPIKGYGSENYLNVTRIREHYTENKLTLGTSVEDYLDNNGSFKLDCKLTGFSKKENSYRAIAKKMTLEEIQATGDLYQILQEIEKIATQIKKEK